MAAEGESRVGGSPEKEINYDRSHYVYENKQKDDNLTGEKGETFT